ncbi:uncharacterized protein LOC124454354 [Xenia sp. Carnegie-2017]|uniref:uncharacterized protein LOC124454354 n=1 Tax=Xenia sp. Carnegie-2017 TaxID=2897299 RepID=UPI001F03A881|nr:uncharacterized protein LOC124454354 [Xenia sp. Carnegie-2017]
MFLTAILVFNGILVVSSYPIVPEQIGCDKGEPLIDSTSPDINITVLPEVFINKSSPVIVVCDADFPRFLPPQTNYSLLQTVKIDIHLGTFLLKSCDKSLVSQCIHKIKNFSTGLPTTFSCTATNARNECRFKFKDISILEQYSTTSTTPAISTTIIPVIKTTSKPTQTDKDDDDDSDIGDDDIDDDDSDSDIDDDSDEESNSDSNND